MGDEYVSVEHLFLALLKYASKEMKAALPGMRVSTREQLFTGPVNGQRQPACDQ